MAQNNRPVVLFGIGDHPEILWWYMTRDSGFEVAGFSVDKAFLDRKEFCGLPVVSFDDVTEIFPPTDCDMLVAIGYNNVNRPRRRKCEQAKRKGYRLINYIHPSTPIPRELLAGENCVILCNNVIQPMSVLGTNVHINHNNLVSHHSRIEDDVYITSGAIVAGRVNVGRGCFLGVGSVIRDGITVGEYCVLGAGSVISRDAEPNGVYRPAASVRSRVPSSRLRHI